MHKVNQDTYARLISALLDDPCTCFELAEETGLHLVTVQSLIRCFRKHKLVHVSAWDVDKKGRAAVAVYSFGRGKSKPRPKKTGAERTAAYRARKVAEKFNSQLAQIVKKGEFPLRTET